MSYFGLGVGILTLLLIGLGFAWVIRGEYYLGHQWWLYILAAGALLVLLSLFVAADWLSALLGVLGASLAWGSTELKEQAVRAELGWYPFNPGKKPLPPLAGWIKKIPAPHL